MNEDLRQQSPISVLLSTELTCTVTSTRRDHVPSAEEDKANTEALRQELKQTGADIKSLHKLIRKQRYVLNDLHRRIVAVSKGSGKLAS